MTAKTGSDFYFDESTTDGRNGQTRYHVLAAVSAEEDVSWVPELRRRWVIPELKWAILRHRLGEVRADTALWKQIEASLAETHILLRNRDAVVGAARLRLDLPSDHPKKDGNQMVLEMAAKMTIGSTALADFPEKVMRTAAWLRYDDGLSEIVPYYRPELLSATIGHRLTHALRLAVRSDALADQLDVLDTGGELVSDADGTMRGAHGLIRFVDGARLFDAELPLAVQILAAQALDLAHALSPVYGALSPRIEELDSKTHDHLQAADVAVGRAVQLLSTAGLSSLPSAFKRVRLDGRILL